MQKSTASADSGKPAKPHRDFPLFPDATKLRAQETRTEFHVSACAVIPHGAFEEWRRVNDDLLADRKPRAKGDPGGPTVELVTNASLTRKEQLYQSGDISKRTFEDAVKAGKRFATEFGKTRVVSDLQPDDFAAYRVDLAKTRRAVSLGNEIQQVRSTLKFTFDEGIIASQSGSLQHLRSHRPKRCESKALDMEHAI